MRDNKKHGILNNSLRGDIANKSSVLNSYSYLWEIFIIMMNCIFCEQGSENSRSVEHIVPESLGNKSTILSKGIVCDECNNYFARKIEEEMLNYPYFKSVRQRNFILTKKGRHVPFKMFFPNTKTGWADVCLDNSIVDKTGYNLLQMSIDNENRDIFNSIMNSNSNRIIIPIHPEPEKNNLIISRFLAKCAVEYLAYRVCKHEGWYDFIREEQFIPLIKYARYGEGVFWPYSQRRIYGEGVGFIDDKRSSPYEILNEMDFLVIDSKCNTIKGSVTSDLTNVEVYFILVIMGVEYAINLGGQEIYRYEEWLQKHKYISPINRDDEHQIGYHRGQDILPLIRK